MKSLLSLAIVGLLFSSTSNADCPWKYGKKYQRLTAGITSTDTTNYYNKASASVKASAQSGVFKRK